MDISVVRSLEFSMPAIMSAHVDFVFGLTEFPRNLVSLKQCKKHSSVIGTTPISLERLYNISGYTSSSPGNSQAIAEFSWTVLCSFRPENFSKRLQYTRSSCYQSDRN